MVDGKQRRHPVFIIPIYLVWINVNFLGERIPLKPFPSIHINLVGFYYHTSLEFCCQYFL